MICIVCIIQEYPYSQMPNPNLYHARQLEFATLNHMNRVVPSNVAYSFYRNWRPTLSVPCAIQGTSRNEHPEVFPLLTFCWLNHKGLMRLNQGDVEFKIHRATALQRNHIGFATKEMGKNKQNEKNYDFSY